jgi:hypothetical protein
LLPLSAGYNNVGDHEKAAHQIVQNRARWVLLRSDQEKAFLVHPSPLGDLLQSAFVRQGQLGGAVFYLREGEAPIVWASPKD